MEIERKSENTVGPSPRTLQLETKLLTDSPRSRTEWGTKSKPPILQHNQSQNRREIKDPRLNIQQCRNLTKICPGKKIEK